MKGTINEITLHYNKQLFTKTKINCPLATVETARELYKITSSQIEVKEYFFVVLLNQANQIIGYNRLSEGGINSTIADIRLTFAIALKSLASGMIIIHNHPSGNTKPSEADKQLTQKFRLAGELLDIQLLDHVILTKDNFYSFADDGVL